MKYPLQRRPAWHIPLIYSTFLLAMLVLGACAPDPESEIISPELGARLIAAQEASFVEAAPVEVVVHPLLGDLSDEEIVAGLEEDMVAALAVADPANGETLALVNGCIGCHALDPEAQMTGPTWYNMGNTAVVHALDAGADGPAAYLYSSIVAPNTYLVPGYAQGLMPQTYAETIEQQDLADLVAYLLQQQEAPAE